MSFLDKLLNLFTPEPQTTGFVQNVEADNDPRNLRYDELAPLGAGEVPLEGNIEKGDWCLNQGKTSSCTCHSTVHAINQVTGWALSPRYAMTKIKNDPKYPSSRLDWGAYMVDSPKLQVNEGICVYEDAPNNDTHSDTAYQSLVITDVMEASARRHKGGAYIYVTTSAKNNLDRFDDIVRYLHEQKRPVKVGMEWRGSFNNARKTGVIPAAIPSGSSSGHDVLAVSWKRINGHEYLGVRNSFGPNWGDKGITWLPKGFVKISTAIAYLPPEVSTDIVKPPVLDKPRNLHRERANAQELQAMIDVKFPLNVDAKNRELNAAAIALKARMWLVLVQAVCYRGWTYIDVVNYLYAQSRGRTTTKAYKLDFTKDKISQE